MRLLFHIDSLGSGGAQRQIVALGTGLAARGHRVEFNCYHAPGHFKPQLDRAGIPLRAGQKRARFSIRPVIDLVGHARAMRAQAIVAFLQTPTAHAELAGMLLPNCKVVGSQRSAYPVGRHGPVTWIHQQLHRLADAMTTNSTREAANMAAKHEWLGRKTTVIRNGYELGPRPPYRGSLQGSLRLLALASVRPLKDPLSLAKALRICRSHHRIPVTISWAGEAISSVGKAQIPGRCELADEVDAYLARHGLTDSWTWLGVRSDVMELLAASDALVHSSLTEGFSNSICEAMVAGRPVIVGRTGEQERLIRESGAGLLFDVGSPQSIAEAIAQFAALSDAERTEMGKRGRAFAEANLSLEHMTDQYEMLLKRLVGSD